MKKSEVIQSIVAICSGLVAGDLDKNYKANELEAALGIMNNEGFNPDLATEALVAGRILALNPEAEVADKPLAELNALLEEMTGEKPPANDPPVEETDDGEKVLMFRPDRGEFLAPKGDVDAMLKAGWSYSSSAPGTGEWVLLKDLEHEGWTPPPGWLPPPSRNKAD